MLKTTYIYIYHYIYIYISLYINIIIYIYHYIYKYHYIYISLYNIIYTYTHLHLSDSTIAISVQFAGEYHTQNPVYPRHRSRSCHASRERGPWRTQQKSMGSSDRMERHLISYNISSYHWIFKPQQIRDQQVFIHQSFWNVDTFWCLRLGVLELGSKEMS